MFKHNVLSQQDSIEGIRRGISLAVDLIRPTYGNNGSNVIVETKLNPKHGIYNDAWSIIKAIKIIEGDAERIGLDFVKELCERADKLSGDSRKTTLLLLDAILKEAENYPKGLNLKKELDKSIDMIENLIDKHTTKITIKDIDKVASTASESEEIGKLIKEIYQQIGKDGIIQVEGSGTFDTSYRIIDGVRFDMTGYLAPSMANEGRKAIYEKPLILVTKKKISSDNDINPLLNEIVSLPERRPLIIFTQDMDSNVASMLVELNQKGLIKVCIIKAPSLWRDYIFEDFSKCVGATIIEDGTGKNFKNMTFDDLGTCDKIIVDEDETVVMGHKDISEHIAFLEEKGDHDSKLRLSWLVAKTALLRLGANSETDLSYKLLKLNDAVRSSYLALKYGIVKGGGIALNQISYEIDNPILAKVLKVPYEQIKSNGTETIPDNIVDASMVVKMAVRNSIGIASTILTAPSAIYIPKPTPEEMAYEVAMSKNSPF